MPDLIDTHADLSVVDNITVRNRGSLPGFLGWPAKSRNRWLTDLLLCAT
jgi:hypothetical protein